MKCLLFSILTTFTLIFNFPAFSQFTYYIGMEEPAIRADLASRNVQGLGTDYTNDGQKLMKWIDTSLKAGIVVALDGAGKATSTTLLPFTSQELNQYIEVFHKAEKLLEENTWLSTIDGRTFKISKQFFPEYSKFGFLITDYDREINSKKLAELAESLGTIPDPHVNLNPATTPIAPRGVYNTTDTSKILIDEEVFNGVKNSDHDIKTNESNAFIIAIIVGIFILGLAAYIILKN